MNVKKLFGLQFSFIMRPGAISQRALIQAINNLPKDDPLEFVFIGDDPYLNGLAADTNLANQRWQRVLRIDFGLPVAPH
jgi:hypothetical protein